MTIHIDTLKVSRDGKETEEFKAVFYFRDLQNIATQLVLDHLVQKGLIPDQPDPRQSRVECRYCEPDGDMGWPGALVKIDLMIGAGNYYPKLMEEESYKTDTKTKITRLEPGRARQNKRLWDRLIRLFFADKS